MRRSANISLSKHSPVSKLIFTYVAWSTLWVVLSDEVLHVVANAPDVIWKFELIQGLVYVVVSGAILWVAVRTIEQQEIAARRADESKFRSLKESGLIGVVTFDRQHRINYANDAFLRMLGYTAEELANVEYQRLIAPEYAELHESAERELDIAGRTSTHELELLRKDGSRVHILGGQAVVEGTPATVISYALDFSEVRRIEADREHLHDQLVQSEKMNALGQLAGGIAHDFNNLLTVIIGYSSLLNAGLADQDPRRQYSQQISKAADQAKSLIRKLLAFSRKQVMKIETFDLNVLLTEMNKMLSSILGEHIDLRLETSRQPEWIEADPGQIEQVVLNLLVNARDAMQRGGTILITSSKTEIDEHEASELAIAAGNYVRMTVTDNGTGMDEATRRQVFEPFFSTKTGEGGTGLGLSTVYGIVRQCGGHIRVESEPGRGSTFTIYFPQSEAPTASLRPAAEPTTVQTGSETILVAEDSEDLRQLVLRILQDNGYKVIQAGDGEEAIRVAKEYPGEIDLVISDIVMPRLSGPEAVEAIRQQRPQIKILLISGDALNVETSKLSPEWTVLEKPLSPEALLVKVREALDQGFEKSKLIAMFIFTSAGLSQAEPLFSDFWAA